MSGLIAFFLFAIVMCVAILIMHGKGKKPEQSRSDARLAEFEAKATAQAPLPKPKDVRGLLSQADVGTLWIITHTDDQTHRRTYEIFVRGVLNEEHLDNLQHQDVEAFQRRNPLHRRTFMAALNGADGVMAKLADGEDLGWAGAELIRRCDEWGIYPGGIKAAFGSVVAGRPQIPGSTGTNAALTRLQFILEPSKEAPVPLQRRDSQFFRPPA